MSEHVNGDVELAERTLREVISDPRSGARVRGQAAGQILRAHGKLRQPVRRKGDPEDDAPDPMADLDAMEAARRSGMSRPRLARLWDELHRSG